ncbi:DUF882 domain-containing protein [Sabulicella glaciei]|uniref:Murein endopeptidase K n=1 Tax=Sabulicella glaciei TaxID=2984948 RepID=A0ABT3NRC6_9PROT|nr:DUF882 domain-containing protein [Roseococcus sp. MDT2-1-1]MCW8084692.1 DUF882 domain-containing protein [Roseococcus sp. MDT2-1-1]
MRLFHDTCPACRDGVACDAVPRRVMLGAAFGLLTAPAMAQSVASGTRSIAVRRVQTGDSFRGVYWRDGRYDRDALHRLDEVLRDPGLDEATPMDPRLFDVLHQVQRRLGSDDMWDVISAYRAPESNAARARESRRVSRVSLHMSGMALDCRLPGRDSMGIARAAADMQTGGVGLYRRDGFVHLDCGPVRRW